MLELCEPATRPERSSAYEGPERRATASSMTRWLARMLDETDHGMLLVTPLGAVRHANLPARQELLRGASLRVSGGQVQASRPEQQGVFQHALADAHRGKRRLLDLGHKGDTLSLALVPMADDRQESEASVLLVLGKRRSCETLTIDFFARTQGLTNAETKVLQALCEGQRPKEAAREFGVAVSTIRTQISSIRTKTQTSSIRDLVGRVTSLPPITLATKAVFAH